VPPKITILNPVTIALLADHERLIPVIGTLRWREWGHPPEPVDLAWWVDVTAREAGRHDLPVTWVAFDGQGNGLGAVGLGEFDPEERRDRSPWVLGMIVQPDCRGRGIGRQLLSHLEAWAAKRGYTQVWVATGGPAVGFYQACGWEVSEAVETAMEDTMVVLSKCLS
jgi:GNAT superfamily N-acetyltransferase